jgi:uncharacterized protein (TIGR03083 family)
MSEIAMAALQSEVDRALALFGSLTADEWQLPSGCAGWRVQDVACHMASVFHTIADPATIESGEGDDAEQSAEVPVQARKGWSTEQVMAEYVEWSAKGLGALGALQDEPMRDVVVPLGNLGSHPLHILANAIVFDHYCHLRHDIGHALAGAAALPRDAAALAATREWMLAGLPQMCAEALSTCTQGMNLRFSDADESYILRPGTPWIVEAGSDAGLPTATTTSHDFVSWATKRADWRAADVTITGPNAEQAATTLDALNII